ncbi:MAG: hypothetical protein ACJASQ_001565 [Crocinitomicaceae bacterium]|jgi:hypothetical protein
MKNTFLLLLVSLPYFSIAQNQEVENWKKNHPNVLCIEETDASEELINRLEENGASYIIYSEEVSIGDMLKYDLNQAQERKLQNEPPEVKSWLDSNREVKIVSRSYYNGLSPEERMDYLKPNIMVLKGEILTPDDIQEFQSLSIDGNANNSGH